MKMINIENIRNLIIEIRNEKVILDCDVAKLYGVKTKEINRALTNNLNKFPKDYILKLKKEEKNELVKYFNRFNNLKHSTSNPKAFTEKGLYMLSTILKSDKATKTTIEIIETFSKLKKFTENFHKISTTNSKEEKENLIKKSSNFIGEILNKPNLEIKSETTIELNLAIIKIKHSTKSKS